MVRSRFLLLLFPVLLSMLVNAAHNINSRWTDSPVYDVNDQVNISANVSTLAGASVTSVVALVWMPGNDTGNYSHATSVPLSIYAGDDQNGNWSAYYTDTLYNGTYTYRINVTDDSTASNNSLSGTSTFKVDDIPPRITVNPIYSVLEHRTLTVGFSAADTGGASLSWIMYNITDHLGSPVVTGSNNSTFSFSLTFNNTTTLDTSLPGNYSLNVYVNDTLGNVNQSSTYFSVYDVNASFTEQVVRRHENVTFDVNISDDFNLANYTVTVSKSGGSTICTRNGNQRNQQFTCYADVGDGNGYNVTVALRDIYGNTGSTHTQNNLADITVMHFDLSLSNNDYPSISDYLPLDRNITISLSATSNRNIYNYSIIDLTVQTPGSDDQYSTNNSTLSINFGSTSQIGVYNVTAQINDTSNSNIKTVTGNFTVFREPYLEGISISSGSPKNKDYIDVLMNGSNQVVVVLDTYSANWTGSTGLNRTLSVLYFNLPDLSTKNILFSNSTFVSVQNQGSPFRGRQRWTFTINRGDWLNQVGSYDLDFYLEAANGDNDQYDDYVIEGYRVVNLTMAPKNRYHISTNTGLANITGRVVYSNGTQFTDAGLMSLFINGTNCSSAGWCSSPSFFNGTYWFNVYPPQEGFYEVSLWINGSDTVGENSSYGNNLTDYFFASNMSMNTSTRRLGGQQTTTFSDGEYLYFDYTLKNLGAYTKNWTGVRTVWSWVSGSSTSTIPKDTTLSGTSNIKSIVGACPPSQGGVGTQHPTLIVSFEYNDPKYGWIVMITDNTTISINPLAPSDSRCVDSGDGSPGGGGDGGDLPSLSVTQERDSTTLMQGGSSTLVIYYNMSITLSAPNVTTYVEGQYVPWFQFHEPFDMTWGEFAQRTANITVPLNATLGNHTITIKVTNKWGKNDSVVHIIEVLPGEGGLAVEDDNATVVWTSADISTSLFMNASTRIFRRIVTIKNIGTENSTGIVIPLDCPSGWECLIAPGNFSLSPNETMSFNLSITVPNDTAEDDYLIHILVNDSVTTDPLDVTVTVSYPEMEVNVTNQTGANETVIIENGTVVVEYILDGNYTGKLKIILKASNGTVIREITIDFNGSSIFYEFNDVPLGNYMAEMEIVSGNESLFRQTIDVVSEKPGWKFEIGFSLFDMIPAPFLLLFIILFYSIANPQVMNVSNMKEKVNGISNLVKEVEVLLEEIETTKKSLRELAENKQKGKIGAEAFEKTLSLDKKKLSQKYNDMVSDVEKIRENAENIIKEASKTLSHKKQKGTDAFKDFVGGKA